MVHHDDEYDKEKWYAITGRFAELALVCSQSEKNDDDCWLSVFGPSGKKLYHMVKDAKEMKNGQGIHGSINVSAEIGDKDEIALEATLTHDELYDKDAW